MLKLTEEAAIKYDFARNNCNSKVVSDSDASKFLEISLMGISSEDDLTLIEDWYIPKQEVSTGSTDFDDDGWAEYVDEIRFGYLDNHPDDFEGAQREVERRTRVWAHTHPMPSPTPSGTDEETYKEFFGDDDISFAAMLILGNKNETSNRMKYQSMIGPKSSEEEVVVQKENGDIVTLKSYINDIRKAEDVMKAAREAGWQINLSDNAHFPDYSDKYGEWLEDIKEKVTEKTYSTNTGNNTTNTSTNQRGGNGAGFQYSSNVGTNQKTEADQETQALLSQKAAIWIAK